MQQAAEIGLAASPKQSRSSALRYGLSPGRLQNKLQADRISKAPSRQWDRGRLEIYDNASRS